MKLRNTEAAIIAQEKIVDYLLNPGHPDNGGKAGFYGLLGFDRENWATLAAAFKELVTKHRSLGEAGINSRREVYCRRQYSVSRRQIVGRSNDLDC